MDGNLARAYEYITFKAGQVYELSGTLELSTISEVTVSLGDVKEDYFDDEDLDTHEDESDDTNDDPDDIDNPEDLNDDPAAGDNPDEWEPEAGDNPDDLNEPVDDGDPEGDGDEGTGDNGYNQIDMTPASFEIYDSNGNEISSNLINYVSGDSPFDPVNYLVNVVVAPDNDYGVITDLLISNGADIDIDLGEIKYEGLIVVEALGSYTGEIICTDGDFGYIQHEQHLVDDSNVDYTSILWIKANNGVETLVSVLASDDGIETLVIPNGVDIIGPGAINCVFCFENIYFPESLQQLVCVMGEYGSMPNLVSITVAPDNTYLTSIDGVVYDKAQTTIIYWPQNKKYDAVSIPSTVTSFGQAAFGMNNTESAIVIPEGITEIGAWCFYGSSLSSVVIPSGLTTIGDYAFANCPSLQSVSLSNSVTSIGDFAFSNCSELVNITIPEKVTRIGDCAFNCCSSLTSVEIPEGVETIEKGTFAACYALTEVYIPSTVTCIGDNAFMNCWELESVYYNGTSAEWDGIIISENAFTNAFKYQVEYSDN